MEHLSKTVHMNILKDVSLPCDKKINWEVSYSAVNIQKSIALLDPPTSEVGPIDSLLLGSLLVCPIVSLK